MPLSLKDDVAVEPRVFAGEVSLIVLRQKLARSEERRARQVATCTVDNGYLDAIAERAVAQYQVAHHVVPLPRRGVFGRRAREANPEKSRHTPCSWNPRNSAANVETLSESLPLPPRGRWNLQ